MFHLCGHPEAPLTQHSRLLLKFVYCSLPSTFTSFQKIKKTIPNRHEIDTGIANIRFRNVVDYLILIVYLLKRLGVSKTELLQLISGFKTESENLRGGVPFSIHSQVLLTDTKNKLSLLHEFIKK
jgi:hypothetical protein